MLTLIATLLVSNPAPNAQLDWKRLYAREASATSYLQSNWNKFTENYHPSYVLDDNPKTAWTEGVDGNGEGQSLRFELSGLASAQAVMLRVRVGYHKNKNLFNANAVPREVEVRLLDTRGGVAVTQKHTFARDMTWQELELPYPAHASFGGVELVVLSTYEGKVYKDTCLSDVQVFVKSTVPYNQKVELAKQKTLLGWVKERVSAAKAFAKLPKTYPFAATQFTSTEGEPEIFRKEIYDEKKDAMVPTGQKFVSLREQLSKGAFDAHFTKHFDATAQVLIKELHAIAKNGKAPTAMRAFRVENTNRSPAPEGIAYTLGSVLPYLDKSSLAITEATGDMASHCIGAKCGDHFTLEKRIANPHIRFAGSDPTKIERVYQHNYSRYEERSLYESNEHVAIAFDQEGRPQYRVGYRISSDDVSIAVTEIGYDDTGKVQWATERSVTDDFEYDEDSTSYREARYTAVQAVAAK